MANVLHADDPGTFDEAVLQSDVPVVVDFWAGWCGPCLMVAPEVEALADEHGDSVKVVKVDVDRNPSVASRYGVMSIPTIALFEKGELTATSVGAKPRHAIRRDLGLSEP
ncbi:MAG: thioredoxin [Acidimicrobiales bacterium]